MVPSMPKSEGAPHDPLERWRHFEQRYAQGVSPFLSETDPRALDKDEIVGLVAMRAKADRWRDRYFKSIHGEPS